MSSSPEKRKRTQPSLTTARQRTPEPESKKPKLDYDKMLESFYKKNQNFIGCIEASNEEQKLLMGGDSFVVSDFKYNDVTSNGFYGDFCVALHTSSQLKVGVKKIALGKKHVNIEQVYNEVKFLFEYNYKHLVESYGCFKHDNIAHIVMPFMEYGSFEKLLKHHMSETVVGQVMVSVVDALDFMHKQGIAHNDIKPHNILLGRNLIVKVADFGCIEYFNNYRKYVSTLKYSAPPEAEYNDITIAKKDIWSLGLTVAEMLMGEYPFDRQGLTWPFRFETMPDDPSPELPKECSTVCRDFVIQCLKRKADDRSDVPQLKRMQYYTLNSATNDDVLKQWITSFQH